MQDYILEHQLVYVLGCGLIVPTVLSFETWYFVTVGAVTNSTNFTCIYFWRSHVS